MTQKILIAVAWPYASADIHVGNITGAYLPADIFARYHRLAGSDVIMVSGSDSHGTPIAVRAEAENKTPEALYREFHAKFLDLFQKFGLTYDLFTSTHTENHFKVAQSIFLALEENGYLYRETQEQWYSPAQGRFLPDRYIEGTCYICGYENARGDQCDSCGNLLTANEITNPRSKIDGSTPELRETEHFFLDLGALQPAIEKFLTDREDYWRSNVVRQSLGQIQADRLRGRAYTRDLDWGIPVPVDGWEGKCIYVWFEAVVGYLSAAIEWARITGQPDAWRDWWYNPDAKAYYFIGKDNIPFHAIIWPAQLHGAGKWFGRIFEESEDARLTLPYDVPANEFMNLEGRKIAGSRSWVVDGLDFLERYDPDPLRYYLITNMPEARDSDWDWSEFVARNNNELVATWGNLANRVLSFANKHWQGHVPALSTGSGQAPAGIRETDEGLLSTIEAGFETIGRLIESVKLRASLQEAMRLAGEVNKYLDQAAPWFEIKTDKDEAAKTIYTALRAIDSLKILLAPFLPFTSARLHAFLGYTEPIFGEQITETVTDSLGEHNVLRYLPEKGTGKWQPSQLKPGQPIREPAPLFKKLDPGVAEEERAKLGYDRG